VTSAASVRFGLSIRRPIHLFSYIGGSSPSCWGGGGGQASYFGPEARQRDGVLEEGQPASSPPVRGLAIAVSSSAGSRAEPWPLKGFFLHSRGQVRGPWPPCHKSAYAKPSLPIATLSGLCFASLSPFSVPKVKDSMCEFQKGH